MCKRVSNSRNAPITWRLSTRAVYTGPVAVRVPVFRNERVIWTIYWLLNGLSVRLIPCELMCVRWGQEGSKGVLTSPKVTETVSRTRVLLSNVFFSDPIDSPYGRLHKGPISCRTRVVGNLRRPPRTCHSSSESWENGDSEYVIHYVGKIRPFLNFNICITSGTSFFSGRI